MVSNERIRLNNKEMIVGVNLGENASECVDGGLEPRDIKEVGIIGYWHPKLFFEFFKIYSMPSNS